MSRKVMYGYRKATQPALGEYIYDEDPAEQEVLRDIHYLRQWGWECDSIAARLTCRESPLPDRHSMWTGELVKSLLRNCLPGVRPKLAEQRFKAKDITLIVETEASLSDVRMIMTKEAVERKE